MEEDPREELIRVLGRYVKAEQYRGLCSFIEPKASVEAKAIFVKALWTYADMNVVSFYFPFSKSPIDYIRECEQRICHTNPKRLAFIHNLIAALEEELAERASIDAQA